MSIQGMRNWIKGHRTWIIVLFALLILGLVITYASSGMSGMSGGSSPKQQLEAANEQIETARQELAQNANDYTKLYSFASLLYNTAGLMIQEGQTEEAKKAYLEAADYYHQALENAPENINDVGKANMLLSSGSCYVMADDQAKADVDFQQALTLAPADASVNSTYIQYLMQFDRWEEAAQAAVNYRNSLPEGDENIAAAESMIEAIKGAIDERNNPDNTEPEAGKNSAEPQAEK